MTNVNPTNAEKRAARYIPRSLRLAVLDSGPCAYCGDLFPNEVDHVIPVSKGGANTRENLVPACRSCNLEKLDFTPDEWREWRLSEGLVWPPKSRMDVIREQVAALSEEQQRQLLAYLSASDIP